MRRDATYAAQKMVEQSYALSGAMAYIGYPKQDTIERVIIRFKNLMTLYTVTRELQMGLDDLYTGGAGCTRPFDFKRDENGFIFSDLVLAGIPYRFTTLERVTGFPEVQFERDVTYKFPHLADQHPVAQGCPEGWSTDESGIDYPPSREPGVKRSG